MLLDTNLKHTYDNTLFFNKSLDDGTKFGVNITHNNEDYKTIIRYPMGTCIGKIRKEYRKNFTQWIKEQ